MNAIDLKQFCADGNDFRGLGHPYSDGQYTYASNGHIAVRVPLREPADDGQTKIGASIIRATQALFNDESLFVECGPIPACSMPNDSICPFCLGEGIYSKCPDCDGFGIVEYDEREETCDTCEGKRTDVVCNGCNGSGKHFFARIKLTKQIGIAWGYLRIIESLPDAQINLSGGAADVIRFRFSGGLGAVMPVRA